jgi:hypothetical protein
LDDQEGGECFTTQIKESKYEKVDIKDVIKKKVHLTDKQCDNLHKVLEKQRKLFLGKLGKHPHKKMHLELLPNAKSVHSLPYYPVPHNHLEVFCKELESLVKLRVLACIGATKWACELNKVI